MRHTQRLHQHAGSFDRPGHKHEIPERLDEALGVIAVKTGDASLFVPVGGAEVGFAGLARRAATTSTRGCDNEIARFEPDHILPGRFNDSEKFVTDDQFVGADRPLPEMAGNEFAVGSTNTCPNDANLNIFVTDRWKFDRCQMQRSSLTRMDREAGDTLQRLQHSSPFNLSVLSYTSPALLAQYEYLVDAMWRF